MPKKQTILVPLLIVATITSLVALFLVMKWRETATTQRRHLQDCTNHITGLTVMVAKEKAHADNAEAVLALCEQLRTDTEKELAEAKAKLVTTNSPKKYNWVLVNKSPPTITPRFWPVPIKPLNSPRASELLRVVRTNVVVW